MQKEAIIRTGRFTSTFNFTICLPVNFPMQQLLEAFAGYEYLELSVEEDKLHIQYVNPLHLIHIGIEIQKLSPAKHH
jgi:hypothetical protein